MELVTGKTENGVLTIALCGKIDSTNAAEAEARIGELCASNAGCSVVVDAEQLEYISSAGLRVILRLRKSNADMKVVNVSGDVYDIFEMTGFTEMIPIEKAYRRLSVEGCEVIGRGANGEVYRLDPDTIIKVYLNPDSLADIHRERELARRAFVLGVPTAIPYDVVRVGNSYGSVFELLNAKSFASILAAEPERVDEIAAMSVELLKTIHATEVQPEDMPDMRTAVLGWVDFLQDYLRPDTVQKLRSLVEAVPVNHHMIHGDYHVKNVMLQNGEALLIDMDTLCQGDPIFEFSGIFNAYKGYYVLDPMGCVDFLGLTPETTEKMLEKTLKLYFGTEDEARLQEVWDKISLIGYTRLLRHVIRHREIETEKGKEAAAFYKEQIETLLDKVDSLQF